MHTKLFCAALILKFAGSSFSQQAGEKKPELRARDLSEMFYTDTLAPRKKAPARAGQKAAVIPARAETGGSPPGAGSMRRVGLKYRILLHDSECSIQEVDPSRVFRSGEKIRLQFESNVDGYLYVLQKGSSGLESPLFPDPRINGGANRIERGILYKVPTTQWFGFDEMAGEERLTVIVSRTPLDSLPEEAPAERAPPIQLASVMSELNRLVSARDLQLVEEKAPRVGAAAKATQATIVINASADKNDAVYTEIILKHR